MDWAQRRLLHACRDGDLARAQHAVYQHGASVYDVCTDDRQGLTALHVVCRYNHLSIVQWIVTQCDYYVHSRDAIFQSTPLMLAAEAGHARVVDFLLRHAKPNINQVDAHGWTALHLACMHQHEQVVALLLQHHHHHHHHPRHRSAHVVTTTTTTTTRTKTKINVNRACIP